MNATPSEQALPAAHAAGTAPRELCRADLARGSLRDAYLRSELADLAWSDRQLQRSLDATLERRPARAGNGDIWVFAYGSLIWNPIFPFAEKRVARIYGMHRSFCLWSRLGRGTREQPGLVLGLDGGGSCAGLTLRIEQHHARGELFLLWRREMVTGAYSPVWVRARTAGGAVDAIAFVMNRRSHAYAGRLADEEIVRNIRSASGLNGRCSDYLAQTAAGMAAHGIRDAALEMIARRCASRPP